MYRKQFFLCNDNSSTNGDSSPGVESSAEVSTNSSSSEVVDTGSSENLSLNTPNSSTIDPSSSSDNPTQSSSVDVVILDLQGDSGKFIDTRDNFEYRWVKIGNQIWIADNLMYDGNGTLTEEHGVIKGTGVYAPDYLHSGTTSKTGMFYSWAGAMGLDTAVNRQNYTGAQENVKGVCPEGWHLPSIGEWEELANFVANDLGKTNKSGDNWTEISPHLRSEGSWYSGGSDDYGFSIIGSGHRYESGFDMSTNEWNAWSSTQRPPAIQDFPAFDGYNVTVNKNDFKKDLTIKSIYFSVRCLAN